MRSIKKPIGLTPTERRLDCYAYACNLNKPQDYVGQIAGYEDKGIISKKEVIERLIADMTEEDIYVRKLRTKRLHPIGNGKYVFS